MKNLISIIYLLCFLSAPLANALITEAQFAATVKSFDEDKVQVSFGKQTLTVPRTSIIRKDLREGDVVLVNLRGSQIDFLFKDKKNGRVPTAN
jgi:hypothetical protein